jgi:hypothetical protein
MIVGWKRAEDGLHGAGMQALLALPWPPPANPAEVSPSRHPTDGGRRMLRPGGAAARRSQFPAGDVAQRGWRGASVGGHCGRTRAHGIRLLQGAYRQRQNSRRAAAEQRDERSDERCFFRGVASGGTGTPVLPTKGVAE